MNVDICDECQRKIPGGREACRADFERLLARDFSDSNFFRTHRLFVDTYALQHPDQFCISAKSFAAHLMDLCAILQRGANAAIGHEPLQKWLNGANTIEKPPIPPWRGQLNLGDLADLDNPETWSVALGKWAESTWAAYGELHPWTQQFLNKITPQQPT